MGAKKRVVKKEALKKRFRWQPVRQVYKITYPTGKIYIGKDSYGSPRYMGSPDPNLVHADFQNLPDKQRRDYTVRKQVLWESATATEADLAAKEVELILASLANDPSIGYTNFAIASMSPTHIGGGAVSSYSIPATPALPAGVTLNATTGVISGTPTEKKSMTTYTVTAKNTTGTTTTTITITVF